MKTVITFSFLLFTFCLYSQDNRVTPDLDIMKAAAEHSKTGEIGVFVIAGNEFDNLTDEQLNDKFDAIMARSGTGIGIQLFIQRTDVYDKSSYDLFVDGGGVGETVTFKDLKVVLRAAVNTHRRNRGIPTNK